MSLITVKITVDEHTKKFTTVKTNKIDCERDFWDLVMKEGISNKGDEVVTIRCYTSAHTLIQQVIIEGFKGL